MTEPVLTSPTMDYRNNLQWLVSDNSSIVFNLRLSSLTALTSIELAAYDKFSNITPSAANSLIQLTGQKERPLDISLILYCIIDGQPTAKRFQIADILQSTKTRLYFFELSDTLTGKKFSSMPNSTIELNNSEDYNCQCVITTTNSKRHRISKLVLAMYKSSDYSLLE